MLSLRCNSLLLVLALVASLLAGPGSASGFVWCIGADGHAEIEVALAGECSPGAPTPEIDTVPSTVLLVDADDCHSCLDISPSPCWGSARGRDREAAADEPASLAPVIAVASLPLPDRRAPGKTFAAAAPRTPEPIRHHRTVVLLI